MKKPLILFTLFILTSCGQFMTNRALKKSGVFDTKSGLKVIENNQKKIIFIPMHHIGKKEFYDDVANKVDSLQNLNFSVF